LKFTQTHISAAIILSFGLAGCGSDSSDPVVPVVPVNTAPSDISLATASVDENLAGGTAGSLSATDADAGSTFTYAVDDERFEIDGATLKLKSTEQLDYETTTSVELNVTVTDNGGLTFAKAITVEVADLLDYYDFDSAATPGTSSVSYGGQVARQLLISELSNFINTQIGDTSAFDTAGTFTTRAQVLEALNSYFDVPDYDVLAQRDLLTTTTPAAQTKLADISSSSKDLVGKIAGNDATGQHKDWATEFVGWNADGVTTPESLVRVLFDKLADNAEMQMSGMVRQDAYGDTITKIYLTEDGRDLKQLIQKFLLMSVAFSQGVDDYLDSDTDGKGLLSDHSIDSTKAYTMLEHQFDEGFGYFGAARNYLDYTDEETAGKGGRDSWQGYQDTNGDGTIDFNSEYNFGQSTNAAKRDRGATVAVDLSADAMNAFLQGRKLLSDTAGTALTDDQKTELYVYRDAALGAWEKAIAATVVHYINDVNNDLTALGTDDFNYSDLAKHWSEMKAFSLGLQFNRLSVLSDADFTSVQTLMRVAPELDAANIDAYKADLITARDLLQTAYQFDAENAANW
jgi:hypothetical protein